MNHANPPPRLTIARFAAFLVRPTIGQPSRATLLVRLAVGWVFLSSGLIKFLYENQGPLRFAKIGLAPARELAYFVGATEMTCGVLLAVGLLVRLAALPLIVDMLVALVTTKIPLLFAAGPEPVAAAPKTGFWAFAYQSRLDLTMLIGCVFLVAAGAGLWSLDAVLARRRWEGRLLGDARFNGGLAPAARFATAPPPPAAGSLRSRGSAPVTSSGDDEVRRCGTTGHEQEPAT